MKKTVKEQTKLKLRTGDVVKVIAGDSKGFEGEILSVDIAKNRAIVKGANMVTKHAKPSAANPNGGVLKMESPITISNLKLVDPTTKQPTRVGRKLIEGKLVRYAKVSGEVIK
jgi:large subunit ribosomal protein L24